jgi:molecular chaperone HscA
MQKDGDVFLSHEEKSAIEQARTKVLQMRDAEDSEAIKQSLRALESASEQYVARRMNASVGEVMRGKSIDNFDEQETTS